MKGVRGAGQKAEEVLRRLKIAVVSIEGYCAENTEFPSWPAAIDIPTTHIFSLVLNDPIDVNLPSDNLGEEG